MRQILIENIQNNDYKVIKPVLDRLGIQYTQKTIKEDDDPIIMAEAERVKNDKPLGKKESDKVFKELKQRVSEYESGNN